MDKWVTKLVAGALGITTASGRLVTRSTAEHVPWNGPVVVKPVGAGSSLGVSLVTEAAAYAGALDAALALDTRALVEEVVVGREVDVAVLRRADGSLFVPAPLEIVADGLFDHAAKYGGHADFRVPALLTEAEHKALEDAAVATYDALGCSGVARIDFFLREDGPVLNEVNTIPGFTPISMYPRLWDLSGLPLPKLVDRLVQIALERHRDRHRLDEGIKEFLEELSRK